MMCGFSRHAGAASRVFSPVLALILLAAVPAAVTVVAAPPARADETPAEEIVRRADEVRNPADSYYLRVLVTTSDRPDSPAEFEVSLQGNAKTLIKTVRPAKDRGRNLLMKGTDMWAYIPNLKRAVRVSLSQRLAGQAANGDISRMRWSGDYDARIERQDDKTWTLFLTANKAGLTYAKLRVVVEKGTYHPLRAEYLTIAGTPLKRAEFASYQELCGSVRPAEIRIQDAVRPDDRAVIRVLSMEVKSFPASMFVPEALE